MITKEQKLVDYFNDFGDVFYIKVNVSRGTEVEYHYYKFVKDLPITVRVIPKTLKISVLQRTAVHWLVIDFWRNKTKLISPGIFNRRFDKVIEKLKSYK